MTSRLLTPKDVRDARFTIRHLAGGYDTDEVDRQLADAEYTIAVLGSDRLNRMRRPRHFKSRFSKRRRTS